MTTELDLLRRVAEAARALYRGPQDGRAHVNNMYELGMALKALDAAPAGPAPSAPVLPCEGSIVFASTQYFCELAALHKGKCRDGPVAWSDADIFNDEWMPAGAGREEPKPEAAVPLRCSYCHGPPTSSMVTGVDGWFYCSRQCEELMRAMRERVDASAGREEDGDG